MDNAAHPKEQLLEELAAAHRRIAELESQQAAFYRIDKAASAVAEMYEFYTALHQIVGELMYAKNFVIALYDGATGLVEFPYWVDEKNPHPRPILLDEHHGVTGWVLRHGRPLANIDGSGAAAMERGEMEQSGLVSNGIAVPLIADEKILGVLSVQSYTPEYGYTLQDIDILNFVAQHIATALERARLLAEIRQRNAQLTIINSIGEGLAKHLDFQAMIDLVGDKIREIFQADTTYIILYNRQINLSSAPYYVEQGHRHYLEPEPPGKASFAWYIIQTNETLLFNTIEEQAAHTEARLIPSPEVDEDLNESYLGVPLRVGETIGALSVQSYRKHAYNEHDLQLLSTIAANTGVALENARLFAEAQLANQELSKTLENLQATQNQLVEAEKMAALGGLVAGVAHEINTPVGVGVTAASVLEEKTGDFRQIYQNGQMKRSDLEKYLDIAEQSSGMILRNLQRAAELIQSFKQVAVDQSSEERRIFAVKPYLEEVLLSLHPKLKRTHLATEIYGDDNLTLDSFPGAFAQIVTNLVMNSLIHAYEPNQPGRLTFNLNQKQGQLVFEYADDGRGIPKEYLGKIFDPFFTTKRGQGGSGLGLHIIYNLVTQKLGGTIRCESEMGRGTKFMIELPLSMQSEK